MNTSKNWKPDKGSLKKINYLTEKDLIEGCQKYDQRCQKKLFELYSGRMMTLCLRYGRDRTQAEDILQVGFIRIFSFIKQYGFKGSFEGWMRKIFVNEALRMIRKRKLVFVEWEEEGPIANQTSIDPEVLSQIATGEMLRLIAGLPQGFRMVFNLYVIEGYDHQEISSLLGISPETSRSQLMKARRELMTKIELLNKNSDRYV